ncbi:MAG: DUF190 domain-containing protein [Aquificaceae bacterium]
MEFREAVLLRFFCGEDDKKEGKPLYRYVVELCKERGIAGATVFRGILGYGKSSTLRRAGVLSLSSDLPVVIEIVDSEEKIQKILPELSAVLKGGIITMERVKVIKP